MAQEESIVDEGEEADEGCTGLEEEGGDRRHTRLVRRTKVGGQRDSACK